jgi:ABC-type lipoprotein export system ATPase subunit
LLNVICGWERPDTGTLEWRGNSDVVLASLGWAEISIVPQSSGLLEDLTLTENISLASRLGAAGDVDGDRTAAMGELLDRLGLTHLGDRFPRETSLGEQQRTSVARVWSWPTNRSPTKTTHRLRA